MLWGVEREWRTLKPAWLQLLPNKLRGSSGMNAHVVSLSHESF